MEAEPLNQTTKEELSSANQTRLLEEVEDMLETMRAVNLTAAYTAASQELRCVSHGHVSFLSSYIPISCLIGHLFLSVPLSGQSGTVSRPLSARVLPVQQDRCC